MNLPTLAARLQEERNRLGITQGSAALLAGISRQMWGLYERGESMPNAEVLMHLLGHGFDLNYLLGGTRTVSEATLTEDEGKLLTAYRDVDEEGRKAVERALRMESLRKAETGHSTVSLNGQLKPAPTHVPMNPALLAECESGVKAYLHRHELVMDDDKFAELVQVVSQLEATQRAAAPGKRGNVAATTKKALLRLVKSA